MGVQRQNGFDVPNTFCLTPNRPITDLADIVSHYLGEHPELGEVQAAGTVTLALRDSFPCPEPAR